MGSEAKMIYWAMEMLLRAQQTSMTPPWNREQQSLPASEGPTNAQTTAPKRFPPRKPWDLRVVPNNRKTLLADSWRWSPTSYLERLK